MADSIHVHDRFEPQAFLKRALFDITAVQIS